MDIRLKLYPSPLPDEHILGTLVRWHAIQYYDNFYQSCKIISNNLYNLNPDSVWRRIFKDIYKILESSLPLSCFLKHTHLSYYSTFAPTGFTDITLNNSDHVERKIIPKFQKFIKNSKVWRWCDACAIEDENIFGTSYWHLSHQIPSITRCLKHNLKLIEKCKRCNLSVKDLSCGILPFGHQCIRCKSVLLRDTEQNCETINWICDTSKHLNWLSGESRLDEIKYQLKLHLHEFLDFNNIRLEQHNYASSLQAAFIKSIISKELLDQFFTEDFYANGLRQNLNLSVTEVINSSHSFPPLYYLLLLKVIVKNDTKIRQILGIFGEKCA